MKLLLLVCIYLINLLMRSKGKPITRNEWGSLRRNEKLNIEKGNLTQTVHFLFWICVRHFRLKACFFIFRRRKLSDNDVSARKLTLTNFKELADTVVDRKFGRIEIISEQAKNDRSRFRSEIQKNYLWGTLNVQSSFGLYNKFCTPKQSLVLSQFLSGIDAAFWAHRWECVRARVSY